MGMPTKGHQAVVGDYMVTKVMSLEASSSLEEAAKLLVEKKIRGAPVVDADNKLVGVLSQFDFLFKCAGYSKAKTSSSTAARSERFAAKSATWDKIEAQTVSQAMTIDPISVGPDTSMQDAAALLLNKRLGRLMVVDDDGQLVGLLSCTDMMDLVLSGDLDMH